MRYDAEPPICYNCSRLQGNDETPFTCQAFPNGIPAEIIDNTADHREPFPGDNGLKFDPIDPDIPPPIFGPANKDVLA